MQSHRESGAVDDAVGVDQNGDQDVQDHRQPAAVNECISEQLLVALHRLILILLQLEGQKHLRSRLQQVIDDLHCSR